MYIDLGVFGWFSTDAAFWSGLIQILIINIILSGDNAVVIALAVRGLEPKMRKWGIILGSLLAVVLRIVLVGPVPEARWRRADPVDRGEAVYRGSRG